MAVRKIERGHYFEDFEVGQVFKHHWGRTINEGDNSLFTSVTMNFNPAYFNREYARTLGYNDIIVNHMLVLNVVFGLSVEDLSERAIAHLGYERLKFLGTVYAGDTLTSQSEVLSKREASRPDRGVVKFRTTGINQRGEKVLEYERPVLIRKRNPGPAKES
ncbi:MAG: MaoC family dehydratase [Candidatus Binataceae bacterium]